MTVLNDWAEGSSGSVPMDLRRKKKRSSDSVADVRREVFTFIPSQVQC